jgi:hypothetical protein
MGGPWRHAPLAEEGGGDGDGDDHGGARRIQANRIAATEERGEGREEGLGKGER